MSSLRTRRKDFDPHYVNLRPVIHWLRTHHVDTAFVAELFEKSANYVSVIAFNETLAEAERRKAQPQLAVLNPEIASIEIVRSDRDPYELLEDQIEREAAKFWKNVRGLAGIRQFGLLLRTVSDPGRENYQLMRLQARLKHLTAEMYLHAGYAKSALKLCREASVIQRRVYTQTRSRVDLAKHAKTCLLASSAHIVRDELGAAHSIIKRAGHAFEAAGVPVDPSLHHQLASLAVLNNEIEEAKKLYEQAYESFPAHRSYLGFGREGYARYDVGKRPLAALDQDFSAAQRNLEIAEQWPQGDIHHSLNLNTAIVTAFQTDSKDVQTIALDMLPAAKEAASGYGRQMTAVQLLELTPDIPSSLQAEWTRFSLHYNAYRNK